MEICKKDHRYFERHLNLPESQDNQNGDRHICAGCAYEEGIIDGINRNPRKTDFSHLPFSQAGTVRHKGAKEAYELGYAQGVKINS